MAVYNEDAPAVGRGVDGVFLNRDVSINTGEPLDEFIVVTGDVDDLGTFARCAQDFLDDVVVLLRPINSATQLPDIDQTADDVESADLVIAQEI